MWNSESWRKFSDITFLLRINCIFYYYIIVLQEKTFIDIKKKRNPLLNPGFITKLLYQDTTLDDIRGKLYLNKYLHSSLDPFTKRLEDSLIRLKVATDIILTRHGRDVADKQCDIVRLSEAAIICFAMFSAISRASRSICLRLPQAEEEHLITNCLTRTGELEVYKLLKCIEEGPFASFDDFYGVIAKRLIKAKEYFPVHPLTRFF